MEKILRSMKGCRIDGDIMHINGRDTCTNGDRDWQWRWKTHCYGEPPGSCDRLMTTETQPYCTRCCRDYQRKCAEEAMKEKATSALQHGRDCGALPDDAIAWDRITLYPEQQALAGLIHAANGCAYISGTPGCGKTILAQYLAAKALTAGHSVAFVTAYKMLRSGQNWDLQREFQGAYLLVIDDFDKARWNEYNVPVMHEFLSQRHTKRLRTIITSEINGRGVVKQMTEAQGGRSAKSTLERLSWAGAPCQHLELAGPNRRMGEPKQNEMDI